MGDYKSCLSYFIIFSILSVLSQLLNFVHFLTIFVIFQNCRILSNFQSCLIFNLVHLQSPLGMGKTDENLSSSEQPSTTVYCKVCGSQATDHLHYGALVCYACRAFFRRQVIKSHLLPCAYNDICVVTKETKDRCPYCRFQKCLQAGMKPGWVMDKQDLEQKRKKASIKKNLGLKTSRTLPKTTYEERMR